MLLTQCSRPRAFKTTFNTGDTVRLAFYNVENLFDLENNPDKEDDFFTPEGESKWDAERYDKKLNNLNKVFSTLGWGSAPPMIGLCEVENKTVIKDLLKKPAFSNGNYQILHKESPDRRGIDVAFVYDANKVNLVEWDALRIDFPFDPEYTSRDIVYARLSVNPTEDLHVFVNHWPSRYGGQKESEPRRLQAAKVVKAKVDEIYKKNQDAKIVILGDFNDEPTNKSITDVLEVALYENQVVENGLFNAIYHFKKRRGWGTYNYRGNWNLLDQIIISEDLLNATRGLKTSERNTHILSQSWLMYYNKQGKPKPNRTYGGPNYYGGFSDHLPVFIDLIYQ